MNNHEDDRPLADDLKVSDIIHYVSLLILKKFLYQINADGLEAAEIGDYSEQR